MRQNAIRMLRAIERTLLIALLTLPLVVWLLKALMPQRIGAAWGFAAAYALLASLCLNVSGRRRIAAGVLGAAALLALGVCTLPVGENRLLLVVPAGYGALLLLSLQTVAWGAERELAFSWLIIGMLAHAAMQLAVDIDGRMDGVYAPVRGALLLSFAGFLLLALLSFNRSSMNEASLSRQRVPQAVRRRNTLMTIGFFALVWLVAAIPAISRALAATWDGMLTALRTLTAWLISLFPAEEAVYGSSSGAPAAMLAPAAAQEPWLFIRILEKIAFVVAGGIFAVLAVYVLKKLFGALCLLVRLMAAKLRLYVGAASEDYVDEVSDTRGEEGVERGSLIGRLRRQFSFADEKKMSPVERIRHRYLRLLLRHPEWKGSSTARDNLPDSAAALYERARYSEHPVSGEEAERFAQEARP